MNLPSITNSDHLLIAFKYTITVPYVATYWLGVFVFFLFAFLSGPHSAKGEVFYKNSQIHFNMHKTIGNFSPNTNYWSESITKPNTQLEVLLRPTNYSAQNIMMRAMTRANYYKYMQGTPFDFISGKRTHRTNTIHYSFIIPETGAWYIVIEPLQHKGIYTIHGDLVVYTLEEMNPEAMAKKQAYEDLYARLEREFIFPDFNVYIEPCGLVNAFSNPNVTICTELIKSVEDKGLPLAQYWILFHEWGHSLANLWEIPAYENEEFVDEFATYWAIRMGIQEAAQQAIKWYQSGFSSFFQAISKLFINDRHTVDVQRARNIESWLNRPDDLMRRWHRLSIPHMTNEALEAHLHADYGWIDHAEVAQELASR